MSDPPVAVAVAPGRAAAQPPPPDQDAPAGPTSVGQAAPAAEDGRWIIGALDRLDAAALPGAQRVLAAARGRVLGVADRETERARRMAGEVRVRAGWPPAAAAGSAPPPAQDGVGLGVARGGLVDRGARVLVLGLVALIVVSATAAILQNVDTGRTSGEPASGAPAVPSTSSSPTAPVVPTVTIGPGTHDPVADYLGASRQSLANQAAAAPNLDAYAVVSLDAAVTPEGLLETFGAYRTVQVFFTAGLGGEAEQAVVQDPVSDVRAAFASAAEQTDARAAVDRRAGDATADDRDSRAATQLRAGCACLFAAVVRAPASRLAQLAADPRVRVVDPAPPGTAPPSVTFIPLSPDRR
ncbi:hypothetical protein [Frankia sp. AgB32]|uniref:hypothetical protein n=1 Tax=Frankia sp. AgB32 TaxID=631119 RepID=UPI00200E4E98|nr:hypothetical protein [Frankia sp. AgB32]MCK9893877.1 hypothetical protein [Frankia sp. AgB32]